MSDKILANQNTPSSIQKLQAQRQLYSRAKFLTGIQVFLSVPFMFLVTLAALFHSNAWLSSFLKLLPNDLTWLVVLASIGVVIVEIIFQIQVASLKEQAALIQQKFDSDVLKLPWCDVTYGQPVDHETIERWANRYKQKHKNSDDLYDWYPETVQTVPTVIGQMICQRTNCWWDQTVRQAYNNLILFVGGVLLLVISAMAIHADLSITGTIATIGVAVLPFILTMPYIYIANLDAINRLTNMKFKIEEQWGLILKGKCNNVEQNNFIEKIQYQIFSNRKDNPLIFDWIYFLDKNKNNDSMNFTADELASEFNAVKAQQIQINTSTGISATAT